MIQHPSLYVNVLIVAGESCWVFGAVSQLNKLKRTKNTKGLNAISQSLNTAGNVSWATYLCGSEDECGVDPNQYGQYVGLLPLDLLSHFRVIDWTKWTGQ